MQILLETMLAKDPQARLETRADGVWLESPRLNIEEMAQGLLTAEAVLSTITAMARPDGETDLIYHYHLGGNVFNIKTTTRYNTQCSIARICPAANWIEREIHDLYDVAFIDHPDLARLVLPPGMQRGLFRNK